MFINNKDTVQDSNEYILTVNQTEIKCYIEYSKKSNWLRILASDKSIIIKAPKYAKHRDIADFIKEKASWVYKKHLYILHQQKYLKDNLKPGDKLISGSQIPYLSKTRILICSYDDEKDNYINVEDNRLYLSLPKRYVGNDLKIKKVLIVCLKHELEKLIKHFIKKHCDNIGCTVEKVSVRMQKTLWGSCIANNVSFNFALIFTPIEVVEYVVVHELCHIIHANHSKSFWSLVKKQMPDYKTLDKWLSLNVWLLYYLEYWSS